MKMLVIRKRPAFALRLSLVIMLLVGDHGVEIIFSDIELSEFRCLISKPLDEFLEDDARIPNFKDLLEISSSSVVLHFLWEEFEIR
jgi:hypothetical protein